MESSPVGELHCEVGCKLERKVDIVLTGHGPENQDHRGQEGLCWFLIIVFLYVRKCDEMFQDTSDAAQWVIDW